jgi:hypothetical protein
MDTLRWAGPRMKSVSRVLPVTGFLHVVAIGVYDAPINLTKLYARPTDTYPTYLRTQFCGPGTATGVPGWHAVQRPVAAPSSALLAVRQSVAG